MLTREQRLDAVVRNYGVWPEKIDENESDWIAAWNVHYGMVLFSYFPIQQYMFTQEEVEARKAELQNKPKWADAPAWANLLAQDANGQWYWIRDKLKAIAFHFIDCGEFLLACEGEVIGDWRDRLEERPVEDIQAHDALVRTGIDPSTLEEPICKPEDFEPEFVWGEMYQHESGCVGRFIGIDPEDNSFGIFMFSNKPYAGYPLCKMKPVNSEREEWCEMAAGIINKSGDDRDLIVLYDALAEGRLSVPGVKK